MRSLWVIHWKEIFSSNPKFTSVSNNSHRVTRFLAMQLCGDTATVEDSDMVVNRASYDLSVSIKIESSIVFLL
jgi:hypothetical protein